MKILIISQHFYPEEFRINDIAAGLVAKGHSVDVVTGLPNYPKGEIYDGYKDRLIDNYLGVRVFRTAIRPRHTGSLNLFLNYMSFMKNAKKTLKKLDNSYDIVFSYATSPVYQIVPAIKAKNQFKCPLICMCCDQWPESLNARGLGKGIIYRTIAYQCKKIYAKCDYIINTSPSFIDYNNRINNVPIEKMCWIQQHAEDSFSGVDNSKNECLNTIDLMFAGNIGKVQNVEDIIRAYNELKYQDLKIHIFGDGSNYESCVQLAKDLGVENNVIFYGRIANADLSKYYKKCDACLLTLSGRTAIGNTIPAKLQGYMSAGKMVIAAINGDSRLVLDDAKCGIYTDPDDYLKLASLLKQYYENKESYSLFGKNGRVYFDENCTLEVFLKRLVDKFELIRGNKL